MRIGSERSKGIIDGINYIYYYEYKIMDKKEFIEKVNKEVSEENIVDLTVDLCKQKTINLPGDEYLCTPILEEFFKKIGIDEVEKYEKEEGRTNLVGTLKGSKEGPSVAIVGHVDVVPVEGQDWDTDPFDPVVKDGKIFARGAADNKGPFAAVLEGVRIFNKITEGKFNGEVLAISTADEELGCEMGVKHLFEDVGIKADYALVPDGGSFSGLIYGEMGILTIDLQSKGRACHGSSPEDGVNAILPLCHLANLIAKYQWSEIKGHEEFDGVVVNIGLINGGTAMNVVPADAKLNVMWRYPVGVTIDKIEGILDELISDTKKIFGEVEINFNLKMSSEPYIGKSDSNLIDSCMDASSTLGLENQYTKTIRAETVGKFIAQSCGAEVVVNGVHEGQSDLMHIPNEYIEIKPLVNFAKYYAMILYNLLV